MLVRQEDVNRLVGQTEISLGQGRLLAVAVEQLANPQPEPGEEQDTSAAAVEAENGDRSNPIKKQRPPDPGRLPGGRNPYYLGCPTAGRRTAYCRRDICQYVQRSTQRNPHPGRPHHHLPSSSSAFATAAHPWTTLTTSAQNNNNKKKTST